MGYLLAILLLLVQVPPVKNPVALEFASVDHALLTAYEIDVVRNDQTVERTMTVPSKDAVSVTGGLWRVNLSVQPIPFGAYTFQVRAVSGTLESPNSAQTDTWERSPGAPGKPVVK